MVSCLRSPAAARLLRTCAYLLPLVRVSTRDRVAGVATSSGLHRHACMLVLHGDEVNMKGPWYLLALAYDEEQVLDVRATCGFFLFIYLK